jgi:hypothetical protein
MKKNVVQIFTILAFVFFVLIACRVVAGFGVNVSHSIWKPRIVCKEATYNFGSIVNSNPSYEFVIQNKGSRALYRSYYEIPLAFQL